MQQLHLYVKPSRRQWRIQAGAQQARAPSKFGSTIWFFLLYPVLCQNASKKGSNIMREHLKPQSFRPVPRSHALWVRGGGGGVLTPNFGRYVPRQSEKWARAPERTPGRAWKCGAPERAWAVWSWKCGAPERAWAVLSVKMRGSGTSLSRFERENANLWNGR